MITYFCDRCGKRIIRKSDRFLYKLNISYPYETLAIPEEDLDHDYSTDIQELVKALEEMDIEEMEKDVGVCLQFEICRSCRDEILDDPLNRRRNGFRRRTLDAAGKVIKVDFGSNAEL